MSDWDVFYDWCLDNGLDPEVEDFDAWKEAERERAEDRQAELDFMHMMGK